VTEGAASADAAPFACRRLPELGKSQAPGRPLSPTFNLCTANPLIVLNNSETGIFSDFSFLPLLTYRWGWAYNAAHREGVGRFWRPVHSL